MPFNLGFGETILILVVVLLFFGPKRLPDVAAGLGRGIRDFKKALNGVEEAANRPLDAERARPEMPRIDPNPIVEEHPSDPGAPPAGTGNSNLN